MVNERDDPANRERVKIKPNLDEGGLKNIISNLFT